jgi:hypothetical protein
MKIEKFLVLSFFIFAIMHQVIGQKDDLFFLRIAQMLGMFSFLKIVFSSDLSKILKKPKFISLQVLLICIFSTLFVELFNARLYLLDLIYPISFFSISYLILKSKPSPTPFLVISLVTFTYLFSKYLQGIPPPEWVKGSRNFVSVLCLYMCLTTLLISHLYNRKTTIAINFILPSLTLMFSVFALGRSGIISSIILLIVSVIFFLNDKGKGNLIKYLFFLILIVIAIIVYKNIDFIESSFLYKFERKGLDLDERGDVINMYIENLDLFSFAFSFPTLDFIYTIQGITLHNSYLHWHYSFGLGAFIILFLIVRAGINIYKSSKYLCLLLIIIMVRSFSDQVLLSDGILMGLPLMLLLMMNDYNLIRKKLDAKFK